MKNKTMRVVGSVRESMTPVLKESQFNEKGVLTPDEFVIAGDLLVSRCPTWSWSNAPSNVRVPYLPEDKQYLVTRNIPCFERVAFLVGQEVDEEELELDGQGTDGEEGWLATHIKRDGETSKGSTLRGGSSGEQDGEIFIDADGHARASAGGIFSGVQIVEEYGGAASTAKEDGSDGSGGGGGGSGSSGGGGGGGGGGGEEKNNKEHLDVAKEEPAVQAVVEEEEDSDDDYADLSSFEDMSLMKESDPSSVSTTTQSQGETKEANGSGPTKMISVSEPEDTVVQCRRYDISITYDKYYQTPRVWMLGYDETGQPLNQEEIFEDIMQDYANKTVTIEQHPLVESNSSVHASIHPCRHASVMKKIIDRFNDGTTSARVDMYLIIFLKFIQSVIPTMNYDFTIEVDSF